MSKLTSWFKPKEKSEEQSVKKESKLSLKSKFFNRFMYKETIIVTKTYLVGLITTKEILKRTI